MEYIDIDSNRLKKIARFEYDLNICESVFIDMNQSDIELYLIHI